MAQSKLISKKTIELLNLRIKQEEESSRLYDQMRLWFDDKGYINLAKLYKKYADEEMTHANWAKEYLIDYGFNPELSALEKPRNDWESPIDIFTATLDHEEFVTTEIAKIGKVALEAGDYVLFALVSKYQAEQQEEISKAVNNLDIAQLTNDNLILDQYIGENLLG